MRLNIEHCGQVAEKDEVCACLIRMLIIDPNYFGCVLIVIHGKVTCVILKMGTDVQHVRDQDQKRYAVIFLEHLVIIC